MRQSQSMVVINLALLLLLIASFLIVKYIFKKQVSPIVIIALVSLLPVVHIFRTGMFESGDLWIHVTRFLQFYQSLEEGILFPVWAKDLNLTYGYPILLFDPNFQYYVSSFFHIVGFSAITSVKIFLAIAFYAAGFPMYLYQKHLHKNNNSALIGALLYVFAPYHLSETHFRTSIGGVALFVFAPLTLLFTEKLYQEPKGIYFFCNALSVALMMLASPTSIVFFTFISFYFLFMFFKAWSLHRAIYLLLSYLFGLCLSSYYWVPVVFEGKYTHHQEFHTQILFQPVTDLIFRSYLYGFLFQGHHGELTYILGFAQWALVLLAMLFFFRKKFSSSEKKGLVFFLASLFVTLFMITPYSKVIWDTIPFYKNLQFAYRLLVLAAFLAAVVGGYTLKKIKNRYLIFSIALLIIGSTMLNWGNRRVIPQITDQTIIKQTPMATLNGEGGDPAVPKWTRSDPTNVWETKLPSQHLEIKKGTAQVQEILRKTNMHEYLVSAKTPVTLQENTLYFPNWTVSVNNKQIPFTYTSPSHPGVMEFSVAKGTQLISIEFRETALRLYSHLITFASFGVLLLAATIYFYRLFSTRRWLRLWH
jgi:hypothetical protein